MWKPLIVMLAVMPAWGASVYKCTEQDGSVIFSDSGYPRDTVDREYRGHTGPAFRDGDAPYNPYSLTEQARRIDAKNRSKQMQRDAQRRSEAAVTAQQPSPPAATVPAMTYEDALTKAVKDAGYINYQQLIKAQRRKVHAELIKYGYQPRQPVKVKPKQPPAWVVKEQERMDEIDEIKRAFDQEQQFRNIGVPGREGRYRDAVEECEREMANCW